MKSNRIINISNYFIYIFLILLFIISSIASENFATIMNLSNIVRQYTPYVFLSMGMLMVILTGGIDLSVGSVVAFSNVMYAYMLMNYGLNEISSIIIVLLIGVAIGAINGLLVAYFRMPAFIATLATMCIFQSVSYMVTNAKTIRFTSEGLKQFGKLNISILSISIPVQLIIILFCGFIFFTILYKTSFGRLVYATGSNSKAVILSGIDHRVVLFIVYSLSGLCASFSSLLTLSRMNVATASLGSGYEMDAIAACVIGGASMAGGKGSPVKTIAGVFILAMIGNIMNLMGIPSYPQNAIKGIIIVLAVIFQKHSIENV